MEELNKILGELESILSNFKKSLSRGYTAKTLEEKEIIVKGLLAKAEGFKPISTTLEKVNKVSELFHNIAELGNKIQKLINEQREALEAHKRVKMTFDIKMATALVAIYNGQEEDTESFLDSVELLDELTEAANKAIMLKFIKTRITGKAKLALSGDITSVESLKIKLRQKFSIKLSSDAILAQLRTTQQGNKKLTEFISQIETLSGQLQKAFMSENVANGEAAEKLAEKFAIQTLVDNVANPETSIILKATNFVKLSDLVAKAISIDKPVKANVLHFSTQSNKKQGRSQNSVLNNRWQKNNQYQGWNR